jgi:hypothetical protein
MKIRFKILLLLFFVVFYQCEKEKKEAFKKTPLTLEKKEKQIEKEQIKKKKITIKKTLGKKYTNQMKEFFL